MKVSPFVKGVGRGAAGVARGTGILAVGALGLGLSAAAAAGLVGAAATEVARMSNQTHQMRFGPLNFPSWGMKNGVGAALTAGSVGVGVGQGINNYRKSKWNLTQSLYNGTLEVETDNMMGATGSMALALSKSRRARLNNYNRNGGPSSQQNNALAYAMMNSADDVLMAMR